VKDEKAKTSCVKNMLSRQCLINRKGLRLIDFTTTECLLFPEIFAKPAVLHFDQRQGSSDGGAILLKAAERCYGLIGGLAGCLEDKRQTSKVDHQLKQLFAQRVFSIACGYPDANDSARLGSDPIYKMLLDRDPVTGLDLASQPTLSRFENSVDRKQLYRMGETLATSVIERHAKRLRGQARRVTIDLDPTDDPTHGDAAVVLLQHDTTTAWCYLPDDGLRQLQRRSRTVSVCGCVAPRQRDRSRAGAVGILRRLLMMVRHFFSGVRIRIRLDGGFAHPALLDFLDAEPNLEYVVADGQQRGVAAQGGRGHALCPRNRRS
jgi:hypothetical protein